MYMYVNNVWLYGEVKAYNTYTHIFNTRKQKKKFLNYHFTYANLYFTFVDFNKDIIYVPKVLFIIQCDFLFLK